MEISRLSQRYRVRRLTAADVDAIYELSRENPLFYQYCPPFVTKESILNDMAALPPRMPRDRKYYLGYFQGEKLIAVLDLILGYPNAATAFIGLFMMAKSEQGQGAGSRIITDCAAFLREEHFHSIRLAYAKGNPQSRAFWKKNQFTETGIVSQEATYTAVIMQRVL